MGGFCFCSPKVLKAYASYQEATAESQGASFLGEIMLVHKGHRIQLLPNNKQRTVFVQWCGAARWTYNWGLGQKKEAYEREGKSLGAYALSKDITELKRTEEYSWLKDVAKSVPRMALQQLDEAYANFFRRCKNGETKKGFPCYRSRKRSRMAFHLEPDTVKVNGKRVRIPKLGWVRMTKPLRFEGKLVGTVAVSEKAGKWYVSFNVKTEHISVERQGGNVGIDLGVRTLATLSDGITYENPKAIKRYEGLLARAQRQLARKQKGSNRKANAKLRVQRIQKRIADIRANAIHQATTDIVRQYGFIAMEDLNVWGMVKNHCLAKSVSDAAFGEFRRQMGYKLGWSNGELVLVNRWFPSSKLCSKCGCINGNLTLADREWTCPDCGTHHDRDENAAKNILAKGLQTAVGSAVAGRGGTGEVMPTDETSSGHSIKPRTCGNAGLNLSDQLDTV